jgi:hypothetical protein
MTPAPEANTRAVARLPGLDVTVELFEPDAAGQEELRVSLRMAQGSQGFAPVLGYVNPMLAGLMMTQAMWAPWLNLMQAWSWPAPLPKPPRDR